MPTYHDLSRWRARRLGASLHISILRPGIDKRQTQLFLSWPSIVYPARTNAKPKGALIVVAIHVPRHRTVGGWYKWTAAGEMEAQYPDLVAN